MGTVYISKFALCHILVSIAILGIVTKHRILAIVCLLGAGFGGVGAAWGRHTLDEYEWLGLTYGIHKPDRLTVRCAIRHAPFIAAGLFLLRAELRQTARR